MDGFGLTLETLEHLEEQAVAAAGAKNVVHFQRVPELGENQVAVINKSGKVDILQRETRRLHEIGNLEALDHWLDYAAEKLTTGDGENGNQIVVWVSQNQIDVVLNDQSEVRPHNGATCKMPYAADFELIKKFAEKAELHDQKAFVRLLKHALGDNLYAEAPDPTGIIVRAVDELDIRQEMIDTFSVLKFETRNRTAGGVTNSTDFLGKEAAAEITSGTLDRPKTVPSVIDLYVSPYRDRSVGVRYKVPCEIVIDYENTRLGLSPSLKRVQEIQDLAIAEVADKVQTTAPDEVKVFIGKP